MKNDIPTNVLAANPAVCARECLNDITKILEPNWRRLDQIWESRGCGGTENWPETCFLPRSFWGQILPVGLNCTALERRIFIRTLASVGTWRLTQGVYRFDQTTSEEICATPHKGPLLGENFLRAPNHGSYILTSGLMIGAEAVRGAFVHQDYDLELQRGFLCILLDLGGQLFSFDILFDSRTLEEALNRSMERQIETMAPEFVSALMASGPNTAKELRRAVEAVVSLYLYLCAENADIGDGTERPARLQAKRTKRGYRFYPPDNPRVWEVGGRVGAALRASRAWVELNAANDELGTRVGPRPHFRRAHWHHYLTGPRKNAQQKPILKWIHQCLVNCEDPEMLAATVRSVESANDSHPQAA